MGTREMIMKKIMFRLEQLPLEKLWIADSFLKGLLGR